MRTLVLTILAAFTFTIVDAAPTPQTTTVTFYHTSDIHDHSGNLPRIARFVAERKKEDPNVLFVDSGDWCNKGDLTPLETRGEAIIDMMAACGYDAVIPGNHDLSFGAERLVKLVETYATPMVAANGEWDENLKSAHIPPYRIFRLEGVAIGIIGTITPAAPAEKGPSLKILDIVQSVNPVVAELLEKKVDVIVLLTHVGTQADSAIAKAIPRLDIIFGGHQHHRHTGLAYTQETETVVQHSGDFGGVIGKIVITLLDGKIVGREHALIPVTADMPLDEKVQGIADKYRAAGKQEWNKKPVTSLTEGVVR